LAPSYIVHARGRIALQRLEAVPEQFYRDMMHQTGKTKALIFLRYFPYSVKSAQGLLLPLRASRSRSFQNFPRSPAFPPKPPALKNFNLVPLLSKIAKESKYNY
jgi:hypothetical protein